MDGYLFPTDDSRHTARWRPEEYILIDGKEHTYHSDGRDVVIDLPGGKHKTLADLRGAGHLISMPVRWHGGQT